MEGKRQRISHRPELIPSNGSLSVFREPGPVNLDSPTSVAKTRATPGRMVFWFAVATFFGIWPALTNGQPFFYPDTTAYVRGADLAISRALGSRFATAWAKDQRRTMGIKTAAPPSKPAAAQPRAAQRVVLAGRSIIYGALLYLGAVIGGMWLSIIVQSFVAAYLVFLFIVRTLRLDFRYFLASCGVLLLASPLPFCVSFLMPDVFAGFLILAFAILVTSWERLSNTERTITGAVLLFAVLSHTTHVILLIALTALTAAYAGLIHRSQWPRIRGPAVTAAACVLLALVWEAAFSFAVSRVLGTPPVRPPFVTAKLVEMLGPSAVIQVCASNRFAVCQFRDRLPVDFETFLWSEDERAGVFQLADAHTKQVLSEEQARFAMVIVPRNLGRYVSGVLHDGLRQLISFGLREYCYDAQGLEFFRNRLPGPDFERMASSLAARWRGYIVFGSTVLYLTAALGAAVIAALLSGAWRPTSVVSECGTRREDVWRVATYILLVGIVLNAIICGGFSTVNDRFEARVVWLIQLSSFAGICVMRPHRKGRDRSGVVPE